MSVPIGTMLHVLLGAERGGCERNCENVVRYLPSIVHHVLVLGPNGPMSDVWVNAGATVDVLGPTPGRAVCRAVRGAAERVRPTAAVVWHGLPHLPQILYGLSESGAFVGVHGGNPAHMMPCWVDWKYVLLSLAYPMRCSATYICCSRYVADTFDRSRYLRCFDRLVILNGIESPAGLSYHPRPFGMNDRFTVGMHARLDQIKDHATVLRAFSLLRRKCPLAQLEFAGSGEEEPRLRSLAESEGVADSVRFLGVVRDVYQTLASWDLFAYATTDAEGFGLAPAEALMLGLPSILTDIGPIREVSGPNETAILTPPFSPEALAAGLARLAADLDLRIRLSNAARDWARKQFDPATFAVRYAKALSHAASNRARSMP